MTTILYDYLPDLGEHGSLREMPAFDIDGIPGEALTNHDVKTYNDYLASLRVIPCTRELKEWIGKNPKEGYERDVDFVIDGNIAGRKFPYYEKAMDDMREAEKDAMKESEDELWEIIFDNAQSNHLQEFISNHKQHFTIKRKQ